MGSGCPSELLKRGFLGVVGAKLRTEIPAIGSTPAHDVSAFSAK
jgi:hypothetical protein